jgi:hypothetical protein
MSARDGTYRGPRWWLVVRLVGAIVWALELLTDIGWKLLVGWPAGPDNLLGTARWPVLAMEGVGAVALADWAWLAWRRLHQSRESVPPAER